MTEATAPPKNKGGRPPGYPKTGGRRKGVPNRTTAMTREYITREADPVDFLCRVCRGLQFEAAPAPGEKKRMVSPTLEMRLSAATTLARKVLPDMKALELAGDAAAPITVRINLGAPA